jgi:hypothetical protein
VRWRSCSFPLLFFAEKVRRPLFVEQKVGDDLFELLVLVA